MASAAQIAAPPAEPAPAEPKPAGQSTARKAIDILLAHDPRYRCPTRAERKALLIGFAQHEMTLYGAAYDVIRLDRPIDLADPVAIATSIDAITICEIKSTNQPRIGEDLRGYFFNITAGEHLTAQSVGARYRFLFVNTVTGFHREMSFGEVMAMAKAMYPAWHIRF